MPPPETIAIVGGGPAGATLATYLARAGRRVAVFTQAKRPPIIVGESLIPAVVPFLRELGIEDEVAAFGTWKGGATFVYDSGYHLNIWFDQVRGGGAPTYSYNVPRRRFDSLLLDRARSSGAQVIEQRVRLMRDGTSDRVLLDDDAEAATATALGGKQPDWIVDASGRGRGIPSLMGLRVIAGERRDTALHAHLTGVRVEIATNVHTDRLDHGWCWRIPLGERVSVGFVVDPQHLAGMGSTAEEQFDRCLREEPVLREWSRTAERITPVLKYSNYQARVDRGFGENWSLVGDAFGFVDPVFSSGMLIAFQSAKKLASALCEGNRRAMIDYDTYVKANLDAWRDVIVRFYDGRLLALFRVGEEVRTTPWGKVMDFHLRKHMPRIFTGDDVTNRYSRFLLKFMADHALRGADPEQLRIR